MKTITIYMRYLRRFSFAVYTAAVAIAGIICIAIDLYAPGRVVLGVFDLIFCWAITLYLCVLATIYQIQAHQRVLRITTLARDFSNTAEKVRKKADETSLEYIKLKDWYADLTNNYELKCHEFKHLSEEKEQVHRNNEKLTEKYNKLRDVINNLEQKHTLLTETSKRTAQSLETSNNLCKQLKAENAKLTQRIQMLEADKDILISDTIAEKEQIIQDLQNTVAKQKEQLQRLPSLFEEQKHALENSFANQMSHAYPIKECHRKYYQHYRGGVYRLLAKASTAGDKGSEILVYESLINGDIQVKPASKFYASIPVKAAREQGIPYHKGEHLPPLYAEISQEEAEYIAANWNNTANVTANADEEN